MSGRRYGRLSLSALAGLLAGCPLGDPVRTTVQPVEVRVVDSTSGRPVPLASVSVWVGPGVPSASTDEENAWCRGGTDAEGRATINIEYTALDRSRGPSPPADRDWVTGQISLVRVESSRTSDEEDLKVLMKPGVAVKGNVFQVNVIDVKKPIYADH